MHVNGEPIIHVTSGNIASVESHKGVNVVQRCSAENQKGAITVQSQC